MAKRSFRGKPKKAKAPGGGNMMTQFQAMQQQMQEAQRNLENEFITVSSGGGAIEITISGHQRVKAVKVDRDALEIEDDDDLEELQDLLVASINQAIEKSQEMAAGKMEGITGGMGINDMLGGLGL